MTELSLSRGNLAWLPSSRSVEVAVLEFFEVPRIGVYTDGNGRFRLFEAVERHPAGHGVWAYVEISAEESQSLEAFDGDTSDAWDMVDSLFAGRLPTVAFAASDRILTYVHAEPGETRTEAILRLLQWTQAGSEEVHVPSDSPVPDSTATWADFRVQHEQAEIAAEMAELIGA